MKIVYFVIFDCSFHNPRIVKSCEKHTFKHDRHIGVGTIFVVLVERVLDILAKIALLVIVNLFCIFWESELLWHARNVFKTTVDADNIIDAEKISVVLFQVTSDKLAKITFLP